VVAAGALSQWIDVEEVVTVQTPPMKIS